MIEKRQNQQKRSDTQQRLKYDRHVEREKRALREWIINKGKLNGRLSGGVKVRIRLWKRLSRQCCMHEECLKCAEIVRIVAMNKFFQQIMSAYCHAVVKTWYKFN